MVDPEGEKPAQAGNKTEPVSEVPLDLPCDLSSSAQGLAQECLLSETASEPNVEVNNPSSPAEPKPDGAREPPKAECLAQEEPPNIPQSPTILSPIDVFDLDWHAIHERALNPEPLQRIAEIVQSLESSVDRPDSVHLLFDNDRSDAADRAIKISHEQPCWFIGDLHGDLLALEAALALIEREAEADPSGEKVGIVFLGDLFDDGGPALALLLRVYQLILEHPHRVCLLAGNHDEALRFEDGRFTSSVDPSDFTEYLNEHLSAEWIVRAGRLATGFADKAPRALFFPDGLLVAHGGFPLVDLHERLRATGDWNDPQVLEDFVWTRAHPKARRKLPNRYSRGSQFGYEDFTEFCALSAELGRPVTHMIRGHDHVDDRYAIYGSDRPNTILTTVALSRRLARESTGPFARVPTVARFVSGALPQVYRLRIPPASIEAFYPEHKAHQTEDQRS
jgi:hypothetical protein